MPDNSTRFEKRYRSNEQTVDLSDLPDEVAAYALDQFKDRLVGVEGQEAIHSALANETIVLDHQRQCVEILEGIVTRIIKQAAQEKINDIEHELAGGSRDDFSEADIREMRSALDDL